MPEHAPLIDRNTNSFYPLRWLPAYICKDKVMSREQKSNKETKKVPALTAKEKKAAKKAKKNERGRLGA
jgi:hypothetical protein